MPFTGESRGNIKLVRQEFNLPFTVLRIRAETYFSWFLFLFFFFSYTSNHRTTSRSSKRIYVLVEQASLFLSRLTHSLDIFQLCPRYLRVYICRPGKKTQHSTASKRYGFPNEANRGDPEDFAGKKSADRWTNIVLITRGDNSTAFLRVKDQPAKSAGAFYFGNSLCK